MMSLRNSKAFVVLILGLSMAACEDDVTGPTELVRFNINFKSGFQDDSLVVSMDRKPGLRFRATSNVSGCVFATDPGFHRLSIDLPSFGTSTDTMLLIVSGYKLELDAYLDREKKTITYGATYHLIPEISYLTGANYYEIDSSNTEPLIIESIITNPSNDSLVVVGCNALQKLQVYSNNSWGNVFADSNVCGVVSAWIPPHQSIRDTMYLALNSPTPDGLYRLGAYYRTRGWGGGWRYSNSFQLKRIRSK